MVGQSKRRASTGLSLALLMATSCVALPPAIASDPLALESEQLAALVRQLDWIDRLAEQAASSAPQERTRYHFDYARLRADLQRVRAGLQDYLVPQRAQPRDPMPLAGDYVRRDRADIEEPPP